MLKNATISCEEIVAFCAPFGNTEKEDAEMSLIQAMIAASSGICTLAYIFSSKRKLPDVEEGFFGACNWVFTIAFLIV